MKTAHKILVAGVGALLVAGYVVGCHTGIGAYDAPVYARKLDSLLAESKKLGFPMTAEDLAGPAIPVEENAWPDVVQAGKKLEPALQSLRKSGNTDIYAALAMTQSATLDEIAAALRKKRSWRPDRDYDLGYAVHFPDLGSVKTAAKALGKRAESRASKGDVAGALDDLRTVELLAQRVSQERSIITVLVGAACESIGLRAAESVAAQWARKPAYLRQLAAYLAEERPGLSFQHALDGEFYIALATSRNYTVGMVMKELSSGDPSIPNPKSLQRSGSPKGMVERANMAYIAKEYIKARRADPSGLPAQPSNPTVSSLLYSVTMPNDEAFAVLPTRHKAQWEVARAGVALLSSPGRKLAEDPFAPGKPLRSKTGEGRVVVWSVGPNGRDEGGLPGMGPDGERFDDIAFVYPPSLRKAAEQQ